MSKVKAIEIAEGKAFKIDPDKKYIIFVSKFDLSQEDAANINKTLKKWGVADSVVVMLENPEDVKVVEQ